VEQDPERPSMAGGRAPTEQGTPPSERLAWERPTLAFLRQVRALPPQQLRRKLRGDLDPILLTALRKEPRRRYASGGLLSEDLRRYREGQVVAARPDRLGYRVRKFVGRHRVGVGLAAAGLGGVLTADGPVSRPGGRLPTPP